MAEKYDSPSVRVKIQLLPPLSNTARREWVTLDLKDRAKISDVIQGLLRKFDSNQFRLHLFDTDGRLIPAWCAVLNGHPVRLSRKEGISTPVHDGDEISFILNLAGG